MPSSLHAVSESRRWERRVSSTSVVSEQDSASLDESSLGMTGQCDIVSPLR